MEKQIGDNHLRDQFCSNLSEQNVSYNSKGLDQFINPVGEDDVTEELLVETQAIFVAGSE